jgi:hypothetical protein
MVDIFDSAVRSEGVPAHMMDVVSRAFARFVAQHDLAPGDLEISVFRTKGHEDEFLDLWIRRPPAPGERVPDRIRVDGDIHAQVLDGLERRYGVIQDETLRDRLISSRTSAP